ncbi:MAG: hypothetical protein KDB21_02345 [Acidimicrobiales bacterium]|nr:hypothetical protein [Acidimicrobiales bacterium]
MRRRWWAVLALVPVLLAAGCGDDDDAGSASSENVAADGSTSSGDETSGARAELIVEAGDYVFELPDSVVEAGEVRLVVQNNGSEDHHLNIGRVASGADAATVAEAIGSGDLSVLAELELVGGPNGVASGESGAVTTELAAGSYVVFCEIPSVVDGVPHSQKGMVGTFVVSEASDPAPEGASAVGSAATTITIGADGYDVPAGWDGTGVVEVANAYPGPAEMAVFRLADGATVDDLMAFLAGEGPPGPPPFSLAGGVTALLPGRSAAVEFDLEPGVYVALSFLPDPEIGAPQAMSGLLTRFEIG